MLPVALAIADEPPTTAEPWIAAMKEVHGKFSGTRGTLALFGDSITVSMAFWAPLEGDADGVSKELAEAHRIVRKHQQAECWRKWRGPEFGNEGGMTIRWALENVDAWLKKLNPEVVVIMFGSNDLGQLEREEYETKTRQVVERCLKNGTVVILTTAPPRHGLEKKSEEFAQAVRKIAGDLKVPLIDYHAEILKRRPDDWDGALAKFKDAPGDEYNVPTLICRDGVHPSYPKDFRDFSEKSLGHNGYALRSALTLEAYADVIQGVLVRAP